jgi:hypothetical protein
VNPKWNEAGRPKSPNCDRTPKQRSTTRKVVKSVLAALFAQTIVFEAIKMRSVLHRRIFEWKWCMFGGNSLAAE